MGDYVQLTKAEFTDLMRKIELQAARVETLADIAVKRRKRIHKLEGRIEELEAKLAEAGCAPG